MTALPEPGESRGSPKETSPRRTWFDRAEGSSVVRAFRLAEVFAVVIAVAAFVIDLSERPAERRARAWQLLTTPAPGNSGKVEAMEYLASPPWLGLFGGAAQSLSGIDLSPPTEGAAGAYLVGLNLNGADLTNAQLKGADLRGAKLTNAGMDSVNIQSANLRGAKIDVLSGNGIDARNADLSWAEIYCKYYCKIRLFGSIRNVRFSGNVVEINAEELNIIDADMNSRETEIYGGTIYFNLSRVTGVVRFASNRVVGSIWSYENEKVDIRFSPATELRSKIVHFECSNKPDIHQFMNNEKNMVYAYYIDRESDDRIGEIVDDIAPPRGCRRRNG